MVRVETPSEMHKFMQEAEDGYFPILVDEFKVGREVEIDLVADGKNAYIPGVMEHIERAGVHSGDSMAIFPSETISEKTKEVIAQFAQRVVASLNYKGIMNIQFLLQNEEVYMLEVNPRASRTVPIISKVIGFSLIDMATDLLCDDQLSVDSFLTPSPSELNVTAVKYPVFSSHALPELDHTLGANMKSTGEGMCLGATVEEALYKVFESLHEKIQSGGTIFVEGDLEESKVHQTTQHHTFEEWVESEEACIYFNAEVSEVMKKRRISALEAGITVITEFETFLAFKRSAQVHQTHPIPLVARPKTMQGVK